MPELVNVLTCANHGDGRLYVNPLVCVDTRVDEDEAVEVGFLHSAQSVFDGVIVLQWRTTHGQVDQGRAETSAGFDFKTVEQELCSTHQHVLSAFIPSGVTVEVLSKAWFYMSSFILQNRKRLGRGGQSASL